MVNNDDPAKWAIPEYAVELAAAIEAAPLHFETQEQFTAWLDEQKARYREDGYDLTVEDTGDGWPRYVATRRADKD